MLDERGEMCEYDTTVIPKTRHGVGALLCSGRCRGRARCPGGVIGGSCGRIGGLGFGRVVIVFERRLRE